MALHQNLRWLNSRNLCNYQILGVSIAVASPNFIVRILLGRVERDS